MHTPHLRFILSGSAAAILLLAPTWLLPKGLAAEPEMTVTSMVVQLRVRIANASAESIVVPVCGPEAESYLCGTSAYLEQRTAAGWQRARVRPGLVLGDTPMRFLAIDPGGHADLFFDFAPGMFQLLRAKPLRVVTPAWNRDEAVRSEANALRIVSEQLGLP